MISDKIRAIINEFQLNNYSFSKRIGVTSTTIDSIINGRPQADGSRKKTKPGFDVLKAIIDEFNVNPDYLFGKGRQMIKSEYIKSEYAGLPKVVTVDTSEKENIVFVPVKARAGYLNGYGDQDFIESLSVFNMPYLNNGTYRCFEVQGDSMATTFHQGDLVFGKYVESLQEIKNDKVYVVISKEDGIVLKRVINRIQENGTLILKSDNKNGDYPSYSINANQITEIWDVSMYASKQLKHPMNVHDRLLELESQLVALKESLS